MLIIPFRLWHRLGEEWSSDTAVTQNSFDLTSHTSALSTSQGCQIGNNLNPLENKCFLSFRDLKFAFWDNLVPYCPLWHPCYNLQKAENLSAEDRVDANSDTYCADLSTLDKIIVTLCFFNDITILHPFVLFYDLYYTF